ncbi:MAG: hypothetical protein JSV00_05315 [bacterium]|nr:MAG: hypothetical protein JSV00_05315 [bacterium]
MSWVRSRFFAMAASFALVALSVAPAAGEVAYIIKSPSGDRDVSIIFSHDPDAESEILAKIGERGHILLWQIQCSDKYVFYRPFEFTQGRMSVRPVLCLVKKFFCETDGERKGYVYQGYLFLEPNFDLKSPIKVTLADKHLRATFIQ